MQVLLRKDVEGLGQIGDVVNVKPGYARNYLLPRNFAMPLTPGNVKRVEFEKKKHEEERKLRQQELVGMAEKLKAVSLTIPAKANEEGHLFGSVTPARICEAFLAEGYKLDEKMIQIPEALKELGVVDVPIQLTPEITVTCKVWVVAE